MADFPLQIATLYAELLDLAQADRGPAGGSFARKIVKGHTYWYEQYWLGRTRRQKLIGAETPELLADLERRRAANRERLLQRRRRQQLARALRAAAGLAIDPTAGRVIARLAARGIFDAGAVLIGTHALICYGPMLGRGLNVALAQTGDVDVAAIDLAVDEPVNFHDAVRDADPDFTMVPARLGSRIPTALRAGHTRVELLTPLRKGAKPWTPVVLPALTFGAAQAPYLRYLLADPQPALYLHREGVLVNVPHPARYALHKLIVAPERAPHAAAKALKDVAQAAALIPLVADRNAEWLVEAAAALEAAGPAYVKAAKRGAKRLPEGVRALLPRPF